MRRLPLVAIFPPLVFASSAETEPPPAGEQVVLRGHTYTIYPADRLRARGVEVREIPRERNAAHVYFDAINAMVDLPDDLWDALAAAGNGQWPQGEPGAKLAAVLEQNRPALDLARKAAQMPDYELPLFHGGSDSLIAILLPSLQHQRQLARLLAAESAQLMAEGRADAALENCLALQRMGNQLGDGRTMIEGLVGVAVTHLAQQGIVEIADSGKADADVLKSAAARMDELRAGQPDWERIIRAEQKCFGSYVDDMIEHQGSFPGLFTGSFPGTDSAARDTGWGRFHLRMKKLILPDREMRRHVADHYDALVAAARRADGAGALTALEQELVTRIPAWDAGARIMLPSLSRSFDLCLMSKSNFERARLALAVAAYRSEHGNSPPSLGALAPKYIREIPRDPMSGHPMQYPSPEATTRPSGMALVKRYHPAEVRQAAGLPPVAELRTSRWRLYMEDVASRHQFTAKQRASAEAILKELEDRAVLYESAHKEAIERLRAAGDSAGLAKELAPVEGLFNELRKRLDALPTSEQRQRASRAPKEAPR